MKDFKLGNISFTFVFPKNNLGRAKLGAGDLLGRDCSGFGEVIGSLRHWQRGKVEAGGPVTLPLPLPAQ